MTLTITRQGRPPRPPAQLVVLRRWIRALLVALGLLIIVLVAMVVMMMHEAPAEVVPHAPEPTALDEVLPCAPAVTLERTEQRPEVYLEAMGSLSAAHLYQSYLSIGLIADAVETEAYGLREGERLLNSVAEMINLLDRQLARIGALDLAAADRASLQHIQAVNSLLRRQADRLRRYWVTREPEHAAAYHEARTSAWRDIERLLQPGGSAR